jgi:hypothetical protein
MGIAFPSGMFEKQFCKKIELVFFTLCSYQSLKGDSSNEQRGAHSNIKLSQEATVIVTLFPLKLMQHVCVMS